MASGSCAQQRGPSVMLQTCCKSQRVAHRTPFGSDAYFYNGWCRARGTASACLNGCLVLRPCQAWQQERTMSLLWLHILRIFEVFEHESLGLGFSTHLGPAAGRRSALKKSDRLANTIVVERPAMLGASGAAREGLHKPSMLGIIHGRPRLTSGKIARTWAPSQFGWNVARRWPQHCPNKSPTRANSGRTWAPPGATFEQLLGAPGSPGELTFRGAWRAMVGELILLAITAPSSALGSTPLPESCVMSTRARSRRAAWLWKHPTAIGCEVALSS